MRGRDEELAIVGERLRAAASGQSGVVVLSGPPGIGKSSVLAEAGRMARRTGVRQLAGQSFEGRQAVPFAPLLAAITGSDARLDPGDPALAPGGHAALRYWMLHELPGALEAAAADQPLAVLLDDLQWADTGTLAVLNALPLQLAGTPILWVLTTRTTAGTPALRRTLRQLDAAGARRLALGPLSGDDVAAMIADRLGAPADAALLALAANAWGNPFLLQELLQGLREEGRLRSEPGRALVDGDGLPRRVADGMRQRLDRLSEDARQVLRMASVLGVTFSVQLLASMLQRRPSTLVAALDEAVEADLLVEAGDRIGFRHDLLRQAVLRTMPRSLQRALQREAASVLLDAGAEPVQAAAMLAQSAEAGDREAIARLREAARALVGSDAAAAADLSVRALELLPPHDEERGVLVAETVVLLHSAARPDDAEALGDGALDGILPPEQEAEVRLSLSSMTIRPALVRAAENRRALALPGLSPVMRARHLGWLTLNLAAGAPAEAMAVGVQATLAAEEADDLHARVMAGSGLACVDCVAGRPVMARERVAQLRELTRGAAQEPYALIAGFFDACALADLGQLDEALDLMARGVARGRRERNAWLLETWALAGSSLLLMAGRLGDARAEAESSARVFERPGALSFAGAMGLATLGQVAVHTADGALARSTQRTARGIAEAGDRAVRCHAAWVLALGAAARDDPAGAARWLADDVLPYRAPFLADDPGHEPTVARIAAQAGDPELGRRAVEVAERRVRDNPGVAVIAAAATQTRGIVEDDCEALLEAVRMLATSRRPLLHAAAAEDAGRALARAGRIAEAVAALTQALEGFLAHEASGDARRVRGVLRDHGVRSRRQAPERPAKGWASLTESEVRVARLVARGATNREAAEQLFLSPHTVSSHLRHAFAKLGINSRHALTHVVLAEEG